MLAWASRESVGVVRRAPFIAIVAIRWILPSALSIFTDPVRRFFPILSRGGVYHTSAPYVILGIATVMYSRRMSFAEIPVMGRVSLRYMRIQFVPFAIVCCSCVDHRSLLSTSIPRYL